MDINASIQSLTASTDLPTRQWVQKYLGSNKPTLCVRSANIKSLAKDVLKEISTPQEFTKTISALYKNAKTYEEMALSASIFNTGLKFRNEFDISLLDGWLNYTVGWAEVDSLCQSAFDGSTMLKDWKIWQLLLDKFSISQNIHKRRASLVLLCKPLRTSSDVQLLTFTLKLVDRLKNEKHILITKAVSWVLRCLVKYHPKELSKYLLENKGTLPAIAYREACRKLTTGKKG